MGKKPSYEELEQKVKELVKESVKFKEGKEALHQEKKLAEGIIHSLPGLFYMFDEERFVRWNKKWETITGYSPEELGRMYGPDFFEGAGREHIADKMQEVFREGASTAEAELVTKDSRRIPYYFTGLRVVFDGKPYLIGMGIDITEGKRAEEALRESEEKYRSMMESMKAAVYICSPDFRVEYMNPAMIKRMGRDATGEACHKAIHNLDERCPWCVHDKIQQGESAETATLSPKDNRYYNVSHSPIFHQDGSISKMTIYRDRTERKRAEEERIRLATAIEQASESIIISDRPGTIHYVNPAFEKLSGFNREEIIGQNFRILKSNKHDEAFYREMYDIISRGHIWTGRIINTMKDGTLREFETRISPVKDSSGEIINFVSVNRDVTQEKALEAQLRHAQRMDAIGTLAGGVAHDFNNILSALIGYTELALDDAKKGSLQYENLQEVLVAGSRAKDLVQQILTFSRQSDQEQKPVNVQLIAKEALKLIRASIPSTVQIKQNIQSEALVMGDSTQIHQVIMNLCTNATQAMDDKGGVLTVDLVDIKLDSEFISDYPELKPGTYINLTVTDTGCGMVPDVLDKIFDPFFTTKEKSKGTGMGLSVVHGIVHSHGGIIYISSEPGQGSTFRVLLPSIERHLKPEDRTEKPIPKGTERILFVDDELAIVNMGKKTLESLGYDVVIRTSSIEALEFFKTQPDRIDIIITDLTMPNMTGEELSKELMQIRPDIPIILCTGFSARMDEKKAMDIGIRAFVSKPILKRDIAETIRKVIDSS
jgi:PAS domain S-box-containing protein